MTSRALFLVPLFFLHFICITTLSAQPSVDNSDQASKKPLLLAEEPILQFLQNNGPEESLWSVIIRHVETGETLLSYNPSIIRPASNLKLITSGAYLDILGSSHKIKTNVWLKGEQRSSVWIGDLIVEGRGDPSIGAEYAHEDPLHFFHQLYSVLQERGIQTIQGSVIGNDAYFDNQYYPIGWSWDDLTYYYAVQNGALSFRENTIGLTVDARGEVGSTPDVTWFPFQTTYVSIKNDQIIIPKEESYDEGYLREPGTNRIYLTSRLPQGMIEEEDLSIHNPAGYFTAVLYQYLTENGVTITGAPITENDPRDWTQKEYEPLMEYESPEMSVLVREMNQESSNFISEMLAKYTAAYTSNEQGSTERGLEIIRQHLGSMGLDTSKVDLDDASGLAASNLISSDEINRFLLIMRDHPEWETFENSLSVNGENGTLKRRFAENGTAGIFKGKTGYISGVRTLSGFLRAKSGEEYAVTIASNNFIAKVREMDQLHNELMLYLYDQLP